MSDPSPGQPTGVRQTPIRIDERGRRVRDDGVTAAFPPGGAGAGDPNFEQLKAQLEALKDNFTAYASENDSRFVNGPGFSGNLAQGLNWNPNAAGATGPGGGDTNAGTADNPYVMGTNSSTAGNPLVPQDDSYTTADGPSNATGGPYDGVVLPEAVRYALDASTTVTKVVSQDGGGTVTISTTTVRAFERRITWDSAGALYGISAESEIDSAAETTVTQLS